MVRGSSGRPVSPTLPGVDALRVQAEWVEAKRGCECGCGTIAFVLTRHDLPRSDAASPVEAEGRVFDPAGVPGKFGHCARSVGCVVRGPRVSTLMP